MICCVKAMQSNDQSQGNLTFFALSSASISPDRLKSLLNLLMAC